MRSAGTNSDPGLPVNGVRLTILDNDPQPTTVILTLGADTVSEGDNIHFEIITATLQGDSTLNSDVNLTVSYEGDTQRSQSYNVALVTPLRIEAGQSSGTAELWLTGTDDDVEDEDETVTIEGEADHPDLDVVPTQLIIANDDTSGVRVSPSSLTVREGQRQRYSVSLATEPTADVVVTVDVPANAGFTVSPGTVTFTPDNWRRKFVFVEGTHDDDGDDEPAAEISHSISSADTLYRDLTPAGVAVTIRDDDDPLVEVSFGAATYDVDEGGTVDVTLSLSVDPERPVTISVIATDQDGASNADYSGVPVNVTFASGETQKTVTFAATQDAHNDDGEAVKLGFGILPDRVMAGTPDEATVSITDDDDPEVKVSFAAVGYPVAEGGTVDVTVTLDADPERTVIIPIKMAEQDGASSDDYSGVPADITINAGEMEKSFTFAATQDDIDDDGESVMLNFDSPLPAGVTEGSLAETTVVIGDDDTAGVTISETSLDIEEGDSDTYTVVLDTEPAGNVTVAIGGITNTELSLDESTLTFTDQDWNTAQTVTVTALQDDDAVDEEVVNITHAVSSSYDTKYDGLSAAAVPVTVTDDDTAGVTISEISLDIEEGDSDDYTVVLDTEPAGNVTVTIGGVTGTDLTLDKTTLNFTTGNWNTAQTVTVTAGQDDDAVDEEVVNITHTLTSTDDSDYDGLTADNVPVTVTDDDTAGVTVSETSLEIDEGDSDTYTVVLDSQPTHAVTITVNDPSNTDVTADPADLTFTPSNWNTAQTVTVTASQDNGHEDEDGTVTHTAASSDTVYDGISIGDVLVNVTDDDEVAVTVSYGSASYTVVEGSSVTVTVTLSADPERTVEVPITATTLDGADAADFSGVPEKVVFNSGDTEETFVFAATQDTDNDDGEGVRLTFGTLPERVTSTGPSQAVVSITDDDDPDVTVSFEQVSYTVAEGDSVSIKVVLDADPERTVTIPLTKSYQGGASNSDYSGVPANVVFNAGDTEKTFGFNAAEDNLDDDGEGVELGFGSSLPSGVSVGSTPETVVSITDDDHPQVTVSFASASYTVSESDDSGTPNITENEVLVTIKLSADPERTVTIPLTKANQDGATDSDYSGVPANVVFNSGDTEKTFSFTAVDDTLDDDGESVKLGFGSTLPAQITAGTPAETTVSITDDDVPSVTASFEQDSYTVAEGSSVTVKVTLSADPERPVTIPLLRVNQGGAGSTDYSGVPASVAFNSGDTEKSFSFAATHDTANDDGESVRVSFGTLPYRVSPGAHSGTTVSITDDDVPSVTVSFEEASYAVDEGDSVTVKVTLSADPERTVTIPLTTTNQGGASNSDYSVQTTVVFNSGDTEKTFNFSATPDTVDDDGESVKLGFGNLPTDVSAGAPNESTVSITDDDVPPVTVSFEQASYTVAEGDSVTVKVTLNADPERMVTIPLTKTNQGGATASDYSGVPASVVFSSGDTEVTFVFEATDDGADDDGEGVRLTFGTLPDRVTSTSPAQTIVSITDDDVPSVTVSYGSASYTVAEGNSVNVKVMLSADPERTVEVPITVTPLNGATTADYSGVPASVVFNSGDTEKTFALAATQDTVDDDGEDLKLTFGTLPARVSSTGPSQAVVSIRDDDDPEVTVSFEESSYTVAEGASVTVKVKLSANPERRVTIPLTKSNQGGASNSDYSGVPANVVFNAGDTEKTFSFSAASDSDNDDGESVKLGFDTLPAGVSEGMTDETTISITDDDVPSVSVSFEQSSYTVAEGNSVTVKVKLDADPERNVTIPLTIDNQGGATGSDYSGVPANVVFNSGDTEKTFTFTAADDTVDDDDESVKLAFGNLPPEVSAGTTDETTIHITDDDLPSVTASFEQASYTVAEGSGVTVKVQLSADPERTVTIPLLKVNEGGASSADYSGVPTNVVFNSGDTEKTFTFTAASDSVDDDGEGVRVSFGNLPDQVSAGANSGTTVSITDDDVPTVNVSFEQASYTVAEGSSVMVKVQLSADPERTVTIPITATGQGGASASDYSVPASVVFNSGDTEKTISFSATQDTVDDDGEGVKLGFGSLPTGVSGGTTDEATVSITDDDVPAVNVSFGSASYSVAEDDSVTVKVTLSADPERTVNIPLTTTNQGGASNSDYSVQTNVVFNSGATEKTFSFSATQDSVDDDGESVKLGFGNLPTRVSAGTTNETTVSITDDDVPSVTVSFEQSSYTVAEGSSVMVKVQLSADPERTVEVPIAMTNMDGASSSDYSVVPQTVVFNSGDTEKTFSFSATDDSEDDDGERVRLNFGTLPARVSSTSPSQAVVSITDDDVPSVSVSFEQASYTVAEGNTVTVKVVLSADPERTVTIPITATNQGNASASDYSVPNNVVFNAGDTEKEFTFQASPDNVDDDGESVKLGFGNLPSSVSEGSTRETVVSITDDDHPQVTVNFASTSYTVAESDDSSTTTIAENEVLVTIKLSADPERAVTIPLTKANQGGASSADYNVPNNVVFNAGDTEKEITFSATADDVDDDGESVKLGFQNLPTGVSTGSKNESTVSITDDDTAGVTISETSLEIEEGDSDTYTVVLDTKPAGDVTVTIGGVTGTDLTLDKTTLTFTTGNWETAQTVMVTAGQDDDAVDEEVVNVTHAVSSADDADYNGVGAGSVAVTVTDDEVPSPDFTLTMAPPAHGDTDGDGKVNLGDTLGYTAVATNTGNVPLENVKVKDALINTSGTDCASLPIGATCTSGVTYTIVQSDVERGSVDNTATAAADGVADKTVTRQTAVDQVEDLELEKTTTADDFDGTGESITYSYKVTNTGTVSLSGTLEINDDKIEAGDITCRAVPGGGITPGAFLTCTGSYVTTQADVDAGKVTNEATASLGGVNSGSDSVTVNWQAPLGSQPGLTVSSGEDAEDAGSFTFTVTLNPSSQQTVTVDYATSDGTASSGADYTPVSGTLTFSPGDTTKNVTVTIADDDVDESDETFNLTLSDAVNASISTPTGTFTVQDDDTAGVTVSDTSLELDEGDSDTYTVVLDSQPTHTVTIAVNDPSNTDVTADPADLTFTTVNWDTAQTVTVTASQDSGHDDEDGTVTHTAASTDTKYDGITVSDVSVDVTDDDDVPVTASFEQGAYTVAEGNSVTVKVTLSADPERTVTIPLLKVNQDGASSSDYSGVPASVVFNSGDTEKTFDFAATDDAANDDGESVRVSFGTLPDQVSAGTNSGTTVSITDDDVPSVTVSFDQSSYTVAEGSSVMVKVQLSADPERTVTIPITKTNQGGASNSDYSGVPANVVFNSGDTEETFSFAATDDAADDDDESVKLSFGNLPTGVSAGTTTETTVSITDDDVPPVTVSFEQGLYTVAEGGSVTVKVTLNADPERTVTIPLTESKQGGASNSDYLGVPVNVVFNSGDTEKTFSFSATQDTVDDDGESVKLGFHNLPARVSAGSTDQTTISITDDDVPSVTVSFEQSSYAVAEGSSVTVKVKLDADPERTVTIPLTKTNQGGASNSDYSGIPANVNFNIGDTEKTFSFAAASDSDNDDGESVKLAFGNMPSGVTKGSTDETTVSITDDDVPSVTVSFEQSSYTVAEGNSVTVKVTLSADPERTVTVPVTKNNQGGASNSDYSVPNNVVFNSGDTEKTFSFGATQDTVDDDGESVKLGFGSLPTGVSSGTPDEATVSITDDDVPSVAVSFEQASYTVVEGSSITIKVKLDADPERTVTIALTKSNQGGATASDYSGVLANVVFNAGDTEKTFSFVATQDTDNDDGESVKLGFGSLPTGVLSGSPDETTVSITDDDVPPVTVSFGSATHSVLEDESATITVTLSADPERTVTIPINTTNLDGASDDDYSGVPASVVFASGETVKTFEFEAIHDEEDEDDESVKLTFGSLPAGVTGGAITETVLSILDIDGGREGLNKGIPVGHSVIVNFEQASYTVTEAGSVTVKVTLDVDPQGAVTIPLTKTDQGGISSADYSGVPPSVDFASGDTEKTFSFTATDDSDDDDGESVKIGFGTLPTGVVLGSLDESTISITDDDDPSVKVSFEQSSYTVAEGGSVTVKVKLDADPERTVTIPLTKTNQGGATASDYSVPASVVFNSGDTEKTFSFAATDDSDDDGGESVKLGFGTLPTGVSAGTIDESTVSITDDDVPSVTVSFEQASYTVAEGGSVTVKVKLDADPERTVTIPLTKTNQGGATASDYSVPASVVFNSGDTEKTFSFAATDDSDDDDGESVNLGFGTLPTGVSAGTIDESTVSITDDDETTPTLVPVQVSFQASVYALTEGSTINVTVTMSADPERNVSIPLTTADGTGTTSGDYTGVPAAVGFASGETEKSFTFTAEQDDIDENDEEVTLGFGTLPDGVSTGTTRPGRRHH